MTGFLIGAFALLAVTIGLLLWPLLRRPASADFTRQELNSAIYRDQFAELDRDRTSGVLSAADYDQAKAELQRRLLEDSSTESTKTAPASPSKALAMVVAVMLPIASLGFYIGIGEPNALNETPHQQRFSKDDIERMVTGLAEKLEKEPENYKGWAMLARSYKMMGRFPDAARAYERTGPMLDTSAELLVDYADSVAASVNGFNDKALQLIDRALKLEPTNMQGLWMRGTAAFEAKKYDKAIADWELLLGQLPKGSDEAETIRSNIAEARSLGGKPAKAGAKAAGGGTQAAAAPRIEGRVQLAPALAGKLGPNDVLMVIARPADGSRMPAAVLRVPAGGFPMAFTLDDSLSLSPDQKLSKHKEVLVEARVSKTGQAMSQPGDLYGQGLPAKLGAKGVVLTIDQVR
jgi:cytochrome c-type biogenesis protein CcmH